MIDEKLLSARFVRDAVPVRLGNLASSVKRLGYFIHKAKHEDTIQQLFAECRLFIEWTIAEAEFEIAQALAELKAELTAWQNAYDERKHEEGWRIAINNTCAQWSQRLLELSGLLNVKPETLSR